LKKYLKMIGNIILYLGSMYFISFLVILIMKVLINLGIMNKSDLRWIFESSGMGLLIIALLTIPLYLLIFKFKKKNFVEFCEIKPINRRNIMLLLAIALCMGVFTTSLTSLPLVLEKFPEANNMIDVFMGKGSFILGLLSSVLIVPAFEEILFRGLIFNELKKNMALPIAFLIQSTIYAISQPNLVAIIFGFIGGSIFALSYIWLKSLWAPVILQTSSCFFMMIFRRIGVHQIFRNCGEIPMIIFILVAAFGIAYIMILIRKDYKILEAKYNNNQFV